MLIVGQVVVDVSYPADPDNIKLRLGGVVHPARMAWAAGVPFSVAFIAPDYLVQRTEEYLSALNAVSVAQLGTVEASPNVMLIGQPSEAGPQGYEWVLGDDRKVTIASDALETALSFGDAQVLLYPDASDLAAYAAAWPSGLDIRVAVDTALPPEALGFLLPHTFITSTSGEAVASSSPIEIAQRGLAAGATAVVVKENRGGTRVWTADGAYAVGAVLGPVQHSVGVGDAYDVVFLSGIDDLGVLASMRRAALAATNYAATTSPDVLKDLVTASLSLPPSQLEHLPARHVAWEDRPDHHIYIAAPDFDWVDTRLLDQLEAALRYHNFSPHRPVREFGQIEVTDRAACELVFAKDRELIDASSIVVAVLLFNDPGTLLEAGYAAGRGIPVILWDPLDRFDNAWLWSLPAARVAHLEEVVRHVFLQAGRDR